MEFTIGGKVRELKFGVGFVRKLDQVYIADMNGIPFGVGLTMAKAQLDQANPSAASEIIRCAVKGNPNAVDVDDAIDKYADENGGLEDLYKLLDVEMGKSMTIKDTLARLNKTKAK